MPNHANHTKFALIEIFIEIYEYPDVCFTFLIRKYQIHILKCLSKYIF
jgi:hypothetical protein